MFGGGKKAELVISEPDVQAALDHLRSLPFRPVAPVAWDRKRLLNEIGVATAKAKVGDCVEVTHGVYAIIRPCGVDLLSRGNDFDARLQVCLYVRSWGTDLERMTSLS